MKNYQSIIHKFNNKKILVIGDVVLDQYIQGTVSRISPEAPVPIVLQQGEPFYTPGGAANVAHNLSSLGAKVTLVGKIGRDAEAKILLKELKKRKVNTQGLFVDPHLPTALKTRILANRQQVLRLDREDWRSDEAFDLKIHNFILKNIKSFDAIIVSDYGKGMISQELVHAICLEALKYRKVITVDPKVEHFRYYARVTSITPNRSETENAIRNIKITHESGKKLGINRDRLLNDSDVDSAGKELLKYLNLESLLITLGEQGMRLFEREKNNIKIHHIDTKAKEVYDVTGAGDTVISVFTLSLTAGATKREAAELANYAAGLVVGKMGAATVTQKELSEATKR